MQKSGLYEQILEKQKQSSGEINERGLFTKPGFSVAGDCTSFVCIFSEEKYRKTENQQNSTRRSVKSGQAVLDRAKAAPKTVLLNVSNQERPQFFNYTFKKSKLAHIC